MSTIDAILNQYQKNNNPSAGGNRISSEERLKRYFTTILPKGTRNGEKRLRILPATDGGSPFVEVKFHELQVNDNWMKIYDPAQVGEKSPLNEVRDSLLATGMEEDKKTARTYNASKFYIVKVIDRDNEEDGPKFWRFKHNYKQEGPLDKIFPIFKNKGDITHQTEGRDLILSLSLNKAPNGREYTTISSVMYEDVGPLSTDPEQANAWANDPQTWEDVYSKKPIEYLELVALGESPRWDNDQKKFVGTNEPTTVEFSNPTPVVDPQTAAPKSDDLPF